MSETHQRGVDAFNGWAEGTRRGKSVARQNLREARVIHPFFVTLRDKRERLGWPQTFLSRFLKVHVNTVGRWESGINEPTMKQLTDWADALGLKITLEEVDAE